MDVKIPEDFPVLADQEIQWKFLATVPGVKEFFYKPLGYDDEQL